MNKKQLEVLMKVAKSEEDKAALSLKEAQLSLIMAKKALEDISHYKILYHEQLIDKSKTTGATGLNWSQYTQFMASLEQSKAAQLQKIAADEKVLERRHAAWLKTNLHRRKLEILYNNHINKEKERAEKLEQKFTDELVTKQYSRRDS